VTKHHGVTTITTFIVALSESLAETSHVFGRGF